MVFETCFKMFISFVLCQTASLKETTRVYFNSISISSVLEYFTNIELDREFLMFPMISYGLMGN